MADLFSLGSIKHVAGLKKSRYIEPKYDPEIADIYLKYDNAKALALDIGSPPKGSRFYVLCSGNFIFGDFIEALIVENEWIVKEMTLSTLSISDENVMSLAGLLEQDYVKELNLIVSDFFFSHERRGLVPLIYEKLDIGNLFQLAVASVHTKIAMIHTQGGNKIVIHGSANMRTSSNIEQIMIENNDGLYDFNHEVHHAIISKYATINKSLRRAPLWQAVLANGNHATQQHLTSMGLDPRRRKDAPREEPPKEPTPSEWAEEP